LNESEHGFGLIAVIGFDRVRRRPAYL
jgi:hypothetical protein